MPFPTRALPGALTAAVALACAPAASADETVSQVVQAGSTITTGTTVSAGDPVQLKFKAVTTGTVTIVKRTAPARPVLQGGPEFDNAKAPSYVGPRFEVRGDAVIGEAEYLIDDTAVPEPHGNRERLQAVRVRCLQENTQGGTALQECGSDAGDGLTDGGMPGGDLRAIWWKGQDEVSRGIQWDLSRNGSAGAGNMYLDLTKVGFTGSSFLQFRDAFSLDGLQRDRFIPAQILCTYKCTFTAKVTISEAARRALGLTSRTIASGTISPDATGTGRSSGARLPGELPVKASVLRVLKLKRVAVLNARQTGFTTGPNGIRSSGPVNAPLSLQSRAGLSTIRCRLRGVAASELLVAGKPGVKRCPNVGKAPQRAPVAPAPAPAPSGGGRG